jgi:hypothetical protein
VQRDAGNITWKDTRLQSPYPAVLRLLDGRLKKPFSDAVIARHGSHVDGNLGHAGVNATARYGTQRCPTENLATASCHQPAVSQMPLIPIRPLWSFGFERRVAGRNTFGIDISDRWPVVRSHRRDVEIHHLRI